MRSSNASVVMLCLITPNFNDCAVKSSGRQLDVHLKYEHTFSDGVTNMSNVAGGGAVVCRQESE